MHRPNHRGSVWATRLLCVLSFAVFLLTHGGTPTPALAATAAPPKQTTVKVTTIEGTQRFPIYVMQTKGIADKYNLKIEEFKAAGPQGLYTVMQTGDFQVAFGAWISIALMRAQGYKFINVYSVYGYTNDVLVRNDSPLKSIADLKGKRIGAFGGPTAGTTWLFRLEAFRFFGFDPLKESKVQFGAPPLLMGLLEKGELDAILILDPQIVQLLETGKYRSIGNIGDIWREKTGQDPMLVSINMNETWAKANADVARRFVAAYKESLEYLKTHTDVWPDLAKQMGIKTESGAKLLRERTVGSLLTQWDKKFIDEQYRYAAEVLKVFGEAEGMPKQIPDGTFDLSYAP